MRLSLGLWFMIRRTLIDAYFSLILDKPWFVLGALLLAVMLFGFFSRGCENQNGLEFSAASDAALSPSRRAAA